MRGRLGTFTGNSYHTPGPGSIGVGFLKPIVVFSLAILVSVIVSYGSGSIFVPIWRLWFVLSSSVESKQQPRRKQTRSAARQNTMGEALGVHLAQLVGERPLGSKKSNRIEKANRIKNSYRIEKKNYRIENCVQKLSPDSERALFWTPLVSIRLIC